MLKVSEMIFVVLLGIISIIDIKSKEIPICLIIAMAVAGLAGIFFARPNFFELLLSILPGIVVFLIAFLTKEQVGYGDAAVALLIGMFANVTEVCAILFCAFSIAGVAALFLIVIRRCSKKTTLAFTPFMLVAYGLVRYSTALSN